MGGATNVKRHNSKFAHGVGGSGRVQTRGGGRGGAASGTKVHKTAKGAAVHMLSHASERSCRAREGGSTGRGVLGGGVQMIAPPSRRAQSTPKPGKGPRRGGRQATKGSRTTKPTAAASARRVPTAGRRAGRPSAQGGRSLGKPSAAGPQSAEELREARAQYFEAPGGHRHCPGQEGTAQWYPSKPGSQAHAPSNTTPLSHRTGPTYTQAAADE